MDNMKADIRTLHNDICERMLGKPPRGATPQPALLASGSEWQRRTMELEEKLEAFRIAEDRVAEFGPQKLVEVRARLLMRWCGGCAGGSDARAASACCTLGTHCCLADPRDAHSSLTSELGSLSSWRISCPPRKTRWTRRLGECVRHV